MLSSNICTILEMLDIILPGRLYNLLILSPSHKISKQLAAIFAWSSPTDERLSDGKVKNGIGN